MLELDLSSYLRDFFPSLKVEQVLTLLAELWVWTDCNSPLFKVCFSNRPVMQDYPQREEKKKASWGINRLCSKHEQFSQKWFACMECPRSCRLCKSSLFRKAQFHDGGCRQSMDVIMNGGPLTEEQRASLWRGLFKSHGLFILTVVTSTGKYSTRGSKWRSRVVWSITHHICISLDKFRKNHRLRCGLLIINLWLLVCKVNVS